MAVLGCQETVDDRFGLLAEMACACRHEENWLRTTHTNSNSFTEHKNNNTIHPGQLTYNQTYKQDKDFKKKINHTNEEINYSLTHDSRTRQTNIKKKQRKRSREFRLGYDEKYTAHGK